MQCRMENWLSLSKNDDLKQGKHWDQVVGWKASVSTNQKFWEKPEQSPICNANSRQDGVLNFRI